MENICMHASVEFPMSYVTLFNKLDWIRRNSDWSITTIARRSKIGVSTLHSAIERNQGLDYRRAMRIAKALRVSADWLLDDDAEPWQLSRCPDWLRSEAWAECQMALAVRKARDQAPQDKPSKTSKVSM